MRAKVSFLEVDVWAGLKRLRGKRSFQIKEGDGKDMTVLSTGEKSPEF